MRHEQAKSVLLLAQAVGVLANITRTDDTIKGILNKIDALTETVKAEQPENGKPEAPQQAAEEEVCGCPACVLARTVTHGEGNAAEILDSIIAEFTPESVRAIVLDATETIDKFAEANTVDRAFADRMFTLTTEVVRKVERPGAKEKVPANPMAELVAMLEKMAKR